MKTTSLKTALGASALLAALGGAVLLPAPASAGEHQSYVGNGAPATLEQVRRRIFVAPAYGYDDPIITGRLITRRRWPMLRPWPMRRRWLMRRRQLTTTFRLSVTAMGLVLASPSSVRAAASMSAISRASYGAVV